MLAAGSSHCSDGAHSISGTPLSRCTSGTSTPLFHDFRNFAWRELGCNLGRQPAHDPLALGTPPTGRLGVPNGPDNPKEPPAPNPHHPPRSSHPPRPPPH